MGVAGSFASAALPSSGSISLVEIAAPVQPPIPTDNKFHTFAIRLAVAEISGLFNDGRRIVWWPIHQLPQRQALLEDEKTAEAIRAFEETLPEFGIKNIPDWVNKVVHNQEFGHFYTGDNLFWLAEHLDTNFKRELREISHMMRLSHEHRRVHIALGEDYTGADDLLENYGDPHLSDKICARILEEKLHVYLKAFDALARLEKHKTGRNLNGVEYLKEHILEEYNQFGKCGVEDNIDRGHLRLAKLECSTADFVKHQVELDYLWYYGTRLGYFELSDDFERFLNDWEARNLMVLDGKGPGVEMGGDNPKVVEGFGSREQFDYYRATIRKRPEISRIVDRVCASYDMKLQKVLQTTDRVVRSINFHESLSGAVKRGLTDFCASFPDLKFSFGVDEKTSSPVLALEYQGKDVEEAARQMEKLMGDLQGMGFQKAEDIVVNAHAETDASFVPGSKPF